jgi:hypothetical protein
MKKLQEEHMLECWTGGGSGRNRGVGPTHLELPLISSCEIGMLN